LLAKDYRTLGRAFSPDDRERKIFAMTMLLTPELHALSDRVHRLESQNRMMKWCGAIVLLCASAVIVMAQAAPAPTEVKAQRFVVTDADGTIRGWFESVGDGAELTLGNDKNQPMLRLLVSTDASDLHFFGSHRSGMNLGVDATQPDIAMTNADGAGRAEIAFSKDGPTLALQQRKDFTVIAGAPPAKTVVPYTPSDSAQHSIVVLDKDGKMVWRAP
jgi:hypothetical protein